MKTLHIFFAAFCFAIAAQAQTEPQYVYSAVPPEEYRVRGGDMDGIANGESLLPSGEKIYWTFIYSSKTHKLANVRFSLPKNVSMESLEASVQAMTLGEFWDELVRCTYDPMNTVRCARSLMDRAVKDCRNPKNDPAIHCWMN